MKKYSKKLSYVFEVGLHTKIISGTVIVEVSDKSELMIMWKLDPNDIKDVSWTNQSKTYVTPINNHFCIKTLLHCEFELMEELHRIAREMQYVYYNPWNKNYDVAIKEGNITEFLNCGAYIEVL